MANVPVTELHKEHLRLINEHRRRAGVRELRFSQILHNAADFKARQMANGDWFAHTEPSGRTARQLITDFGYPPNTWSGENILYGTEGAQQTFNVWWNSAPHRENILNPNYTEIGVALNVEPNWDFTNDVFLVGVQEFGGGSTPGPSEEETPVVSYPSEPERPVRPPRYVRPLRPVITPNPPNNQKLEGLAERIRNHVYRLLGR